MLKLRVQEYARSVSRHDTMSVGSEPISVCHGQRKEADHAE